MNLKYTRSCIALAATIGCGASLAAAHIVDISWSSDARFVHNALIPAGKFVEVCGKLTVGDTIRWSFTAAGPVDFNIHYHVGKEAVFPAKQVQVSKGRDSMRVAVAQDYCWMWTNKGKGDVSVSVELAR